MDLQVREKGVGDGHNALALQPAAPIHDHAWVTTPMFIATIAAKFRRVEDLGGIGGQLKAEAKVGDHLEGGFSGKILGAQGLDDLFLLGEAVVVANKRVGEGRF